MGNTQSRIVGSVYYVAYSVSALITLVCLFGIPRAQVLLVGDFVQAQQNAPTITIGTTTTNYGSTSGGTPGIMYNAKLSSDGTKVLLADRDLGPVIADAAPYAFLRRSSVTAITRVCTFDGNEASTSSSTAKVYCRRQPPSDNFFAFLFSDLSIQQDGSSNNPLVIGSGSNIGQNGMFTIVQGSGASNDFLFVASDDYSSSMLRIDVSSTLTYTGTITSTKRITDTSSGGSKRYVWGACGSDGANCYLISEEKYLGKFTQGTSSVDPVYVSTIDLGVAGQLQGKDIHPNLNAVVIDNINNQLFVGSTDEGNAVLKISLATFSFVSRLVLSTSGDGMVLCEHCFTNGNLFLLVLKFGDAQTHFINVTSMTELTDSSSFVNLGSGNKPSAGWLSQSADSGVLITDQKQAVSVTTSGVTTPAPPTPVPSTAAPPTTVVSSTTTTTTTAPSNNKQDKKQSVATGVIIGSSVGSVAGLCAIVVGIFFLHKHFNSNDNSEKESAAPTSTSAEVNSEELKEVK